MKKFTTNLPEISRYFNSYEEYLRTAKLKCIIGNIDYHLGRLDLTSSTIKTKGKTFNEFLLGEYNTYNSEEDIGSVLTQSLIGKKLYLRLDGYTEYLPNNPYVYSIQDEETDDMLEIVLTDEKTLSDVILEHYAYVYDKATRKYIKSLDFNTVKKRFEKERIRFEINRDVGDTYDLVADQSKLILHMLGVKLLPEDKLERIVQTQKDILNIVEKDRK